MSRGMAEAAAIYQAPLMRTTPSMPAPAPEAASADADQPLGAARCQVHGTYIVAQTGDGRSTYQVNKEKKERAAQVTLYKSAKQAISMCGTRPELDEWWRENQATLEDKLPDAGFQEIVTALDARRSDLPPM